MSLGLNELIKTCTYPWSLLHCQHTWKWDKIRSNLYQYVITGLQHQNYYILKMIYKCMRFSLQVMVICKILVHQFNWLRLYDPNKHKLTRSLLVQVMAWRRTGIWANADFISIRHLGTNLSEILIKIHKFSFRNFVRILIRLQSTYKSTATV